MRVQHNLVFWRQFPDLMIDFYWNHDIKCWSGINEWAIWGITLCRLTYNMQDLWLFPTWLVLITSHVVPWTLKGSVQGNFLSNTARIFLRCTCDNCIMCIQSCLCSPSLFCPNLMKLTCNFYNLSCSLRSMSNAWWEIPYTIRRKYIFIYFVTKTCTHDTVLIWCEILQVAYNDYLF